MTRAIRPFVFFEGAAFVAAALTHFGVLIAGYEHQKAGTAESVIGIVLLLGWVLTWMRPRSTHGIGLAVQGFALLGTLVGIFTIAIGVGPRTAPDIAFHIAVLHASANPFYQQFRDVVTTALRTSIRFTNRFKGRTASLPQHLAVLSAIQKRNPNRAKAAMIALIADVMTLIADAERKV